MIRKAIIAVAVIIFVFSVTCLIGESFLCLINYSYLPLKIERLGKNIDGLGEADFRQFHCEEDENFVYDHRLIWRAKKKYHRFNNQGFIGSDLTAAKKKDDYYIFTIGDSNTFGSWPEYLNSFFRNNHAGVKVVNAGIPGYSSFQGLRYFEEILRYKLYMALISFGTNDAHRVTVSDKEYVFNKRFFNSRITQFRLFQLFSALSDIILMKNKKENHLVPRVSLKEYEDNICNIIDLADKNHVKIVLLTRPFIGTSHSKLWWKVFAPEYNKLSKKIAKNRGVSVIDIYSCFKDKAEYFIDESHFNVAGHKAAAEIIYRHIKSL